MIIKLIPIYLLLSLGLLVNLASAQEINFKLTIKIESAYPGRRAFLYYRSAATSNVVDSASYIDGKYEIKGKISKNQRAFVALAPENTGFQVYKVTELRIPVYLQEGNILITAEKDLKNAKLSGTPLNVVHQGYRDILTSKDIQLDLLKDSYLKANQRKDTLEMSKITRSFDKVEIDSRAAQEEYFLAHLNSLVSLHWLTGTFNIARERSKVESLFKQLTDEVKQTESGHSYSTLLEKTPSVEIGKNAPNFTANNTDGQPIALESFRGKYVLLDFWASWCVPCRKENPNVLKLYNAYASKNFTVVGFSIDSNKARWDNAVAKDGLVWTQLAGFGKDGNQEPANIYGVASIPSNFLIDPKGKIIATDLRGDELEKALIKFIKK